MQPRKEGLWEVGTLHERLRVRKCQRCCLCPGHLTPPPQPPIGHTSAGQPLCLRWLFLRTGLRKSVFVPLFSPTMEAPEERAWLWRGREVLEVAETQCYPTTVGTFRTRSPIARFHDGHGDPRALCLSRPRQLVRCMKTGPLNQPRVFPASGTCMRTVLEPMDRPCLG